MKRILVLILILVSIIGVAAAENSFTDSETWICPNCGNNSRGNFCSNCGTSKPQSEWNALNGQPLKLL